MTGLSIAALGREIAKARAIQAEGDLAAALSPLADLDTVSEVRTGLGAVTAIQLADPAEGPAMVGRMRAQGVSGRVAGQGALQISPAFVMTTAEVTELADRLKAALTF